MLPKLILETQQITIIKNDHQGKEVWRYPGVIIENAQHAVVVEAYFNRKDLLFNGVLLKENDRFVEYYSTIKWFNIYEIYDRDNQRLKAYYCNVTRPAVWKDGYLQYDDLALDLLIDSKGKQQTLDEDEFVKIKLNEREVKKALHALSELQIFFTRMEKKPIDSDAIKSLLGLTQE